MMIEDKTIRFIGDGYEYQIKEYCDGLQLIDINYLEDGQLKDSICFQKTELSQIVQALKLFGIE